MREYFLAFIMIIFAVAIILAIYSFDKEIYANKRPFIIQQGRLFLDNQNKTIDYIDINGNNVVCHNYKGDVWICN